MEFSGVVGVGKKYGRTIGFPTANIPLTDRSVAGIYTATVTLDGETFPAAVYANPERGVLEAHIIDWIGDIYEKPIVVTLREKVRESEEFEDELALMAAIAADVALIRESFNH
ncbi:MAG TPA: riboflavin kinase [Candidatus Paceibacterota bacterium]|nr:riboflavin kinase [Candidatus Paceibacterota bacterium]